MNVDFSRIRIFLRVGKTDMRKSIRGLAVLVQDGMLENPLSGDLYLFSNRGRLLKALYWDRNGFCLWQKRLEKHRFPWPANGEGSIELTAEQIGWLLQGIDFFHAHEELRFSIIG